MNFAYCCGIIFLVVCLNQVNSQIADTDGKLIEFI